MEKYFGRLSQACILPKNHTHGYNKIAKTSLTRVPLLTNYQKKQFDSSEKREGWRKNSLET